MYGLKIASITALSFVLIAPVYAQSIGGTSPMDLNTISSAGLSAHIGNLSIAKTARQSAGRHYPTGNSLPAHAHLPYQASPALRQQVLNEFLARAKKHNPAAAEAIDAQFRRPQVRGFADSAIRSVGLSPGDAADAMTVYLVTGWEVVNGRDASRASIAPARRQIAAELMTDPAMRDPVTRAKFAEELKILATIIGGGAQSAVREGTTQNYASQTAAYYQKQTGHDFRRMRLTPAGIEW